MKISKTFIYIIQVGLMNCQNKRMLDAFYQVKCSTVMTKQFLIQLLESFFLKGAHIYIKYAT